MLIFEFSGLPPSVNHTYSKNRFAFYKIREVKEWQEGMSYLIKQASGGLHFEGKVSASFRFCTKNNRRMDLDNRIKALQDVLMIAGVLNDDSQIWELKIRREIAEEEKTIVKIDEL